CLVCHAPFRGTTARMARGNEQHQLIGPWPGRCRFVAGTHSAQRDGLADGHSTSGRGARRGSGQVTPCVSVDELPAWRVASSGGARIGRCAGGHQGSVQGEGTWRSAPQAGTAAGPCLITTMVPSQVSMCVYLFFPWA